MKSYYVYILQCADGSYYTGVTNDIERRYYEHQEGLIEGCYTHNKRPVELMHVEEFRDIVEAISMEKQIKGWSRQKKKALIAGNYQKLVELSKSHHPELVEGRQAQDDIVMVTLRQAQSDNGAFVMVSLSNHQGDNLPIPNEKEPKDSNR